MNLSIIDDVLNNCVYCIWIKDTKDIINRLSLIYKSLNTLKYKYGLTNIPKYLNYRIGCFEEKICRSIPINFSTQEHFLKINYTLNTISNLELCSILKYTDDDYIFLMSSMLNNLDEFNFLNKLKYLKCTILKI